MNDIQTLQDVVDVLTEHGYTPTLAENKVTLPIGSAESPFPCIILMDETYLTVFCEIDTYGNMMSRVSEEDREDFLVAMLDLNSQMNSYAFTVSRCRGGQRQLACCSYQQRACWRSIRGRASGRYACFAGSIVDCKDSLHRECCREFVICDKQVCKKLNYLIKVGE